MNIVLEIIKIALWILFSLFVIFSLVVVRQVQLMTRVLTVPISGSLKFVSIGLLTLTTSMLLMAIILL